MQKREPMCRLRMTKYKDKWCQEAYNKGFEEGRDFEKENSTKQMEQDLKDSEESK